MTDRRVCFDFEIDFTNGGGVQGQDFRLDIAGEDIGDADLADYIVRDLGLLMVGEVRILNRRIIEERHKGTRAPRTGSPKPEPGIRLIDLSRGDGEGRRTEPFASSGQADDIVSSTGEPQSMGSQLWVPDSATRVRLPRRDAAHPHSRSLDATTDLPAVMVRLTGSERLAIDRLSLAAVDVTGRAVLINTGWIRDGGTQTRPENHPFLTMDAAVWLRDQRAVLVGIDTPGVDDGAAGASSARSILLAADIPIVENLTELDQLPTDGFHFSASPILGGSLSTPARAYARFQNS